MSWKKFNCTLKSTEDKKIRVVGIIFWGDWKHRNTEGFKLNRTRKKKDFRNIQGVNFNQEYVLNHVIKLINTIKPNVAVADNIK